MKRRPPMRVALALALALAACAASPAALPQKPFPSTIAEVATLSAQGVRWSNADIRAWYVAQARRIAGDDAARAARGLSVEARAREAFRTRHDARLLARAMMSDKSQVAELEARDRAKYGHPDGPTFDDLVAKQRAKGHAGDDVYRAIIESAGRTDAAVNALSGL